MKAGGVSAKGVVFALTLGAMTWGQSAQAAVDPGNLCVSTKMLSAGTYCRSVLKAWSAWDKNQDATKRDEKLSKASSKLADKWTKAEDKASLKGVDCANTTFSASGMKLMMGTTVAEVVAYTNTGLDLGNKDDAKCGSKFLTAAARKCAGLLKAESKYIKKPDKDPGGAARDADKVKVSGKFTEDWNKVIALGCAAGSSVTYVEEIVDSINDEVVTATTPSPDVPAPTSISDRGVQEHGKVFPMSIDSAYMGTWGENRNSGATLVTSFEQRKLAGQSEYLSWTMPNSPPVSALMSNGSTEASNGLIIAASPRGGGTSTVVALDLKGKVVWRTQEWSSDDLDHDGIPDLAGQGNAVASSGGIQAPMVDKEGGVYVSDNYGIWKLDQDTGARIWFSRFSDYSGNTLGSNDLRMVNEGDDGLVGTVFASGWHIWVDRHTGAPVIVKAPDPFSANDCPANSKLYITIAGGELDKSGELKDIVCLAYNANNTVPQPNNVAIRPAIPGVSQHSRYMFTYAGPVGQPDSARLIAYDFTYNAQDGWGVQKAWERVVSGGTGASPTITPDYKVVNATDITGALNFTDVETGAALPDPGVPFNSFGSPSNTIEGLYCDSWSSTCISVDGKTVIQADPSVTGQIASQALPELTPIPFLWGGTPDANYIGGAIVDPARWTFTATVGYHYKLGDTLGNFVRLGFISPTAMVPVTFDARNGKLMPGQSFGPELTRPGTSEANAMVTTTGRYVVQKAELLSLFYYYLFQGNYNFFNTNSVDYDDNTPAEFAQLQGLSAVFNAQIGGSGPIGPAGIVPDPWKVGQPEAGLTIYEPTSFVVEARNQVEMAIWFAEFAKKNLCLTAGCALEEAAARLGYAAWNLDKAFQRQLAEATARAEIDPPHSLSIATDATAAAADCRNARAELLAMQPALPTAGALGAARTLTKSCLSRLTALDNAL